MDDMLLVITPPNRLAQLRRDFVPAHPVYRVGRDGRLFRVGQANPRGGAMVLDVSGFDSRSDASNLCRQVVHECGVRNFCAVVSVGVLSRQVVTKLDDGLSD